MKIKKEYYCIADKNNKPDFRFLFESSRDAKKQIKFIKNSISGETIFLGKNKKDFFVDGIKKAFVDPDKKIQLRRGCWTGLSVKKLKLIDTIEPENVFKKVIKSEESAFSYSKQKQREFFPQNHLIQVPSVSNLFAGFDWDNSFIRTRAFLGGVSVMCVAAITSVFLISHSTANSIAEEMMKSQKIATEKTIAIQTKVLGMKDEKANSQFENNLDKFVLDTLKQFDNIKSEEFEGELKGILAGSPMEKMTPLIAKQDRTIAAFIVGIAKKESDFGRHVPVLNGQDCFNYWGYRGIRSRMGSGGHTCFDSPEDAINTVAGRIKDLVQADVDTPQEMVIWKCGSACNQDSQWAVKKWINDVSIYFQEISNKSKDNA
jgi:hypothetical protein